MSPESLTTFRLTFWFPGNHYRGRMGSFLRVSWLIPAMLLAMVSVCFPDAAQQAPKEPKRTFQVSAIEEGDPIKVDGILDEPEWKKPPTFTLDYETTPGDNIAPPVHTDMWITYDKSNLYVAARCQDPHPESIRARLTDRDRAFQDDFVGVVLDTFNDERRAFEFFVNPLGVQMDLSQNDLTGNEDETWDAIWNSAGHVTSSGYEVEMEIPFSSLRFPPTTGPGTWGIDAVRIYPRDQRYRIGLNKLPRGVNCYLCNESKLQGFDSVRPGRNLEFDPTLTGQNIHQRDDLAQPFDHKQNLEPGITGRWGLTPGINFIGTINPDFSQVEADAQQLTVNTQFAIFYPEKRPFFLEGADLFDTKIQAIYTRDIADPSWGTKVVGKSGKSAFGIIVAKDDTTNLLFPSSQSSDLETLDEANTSSIFRYRYDVSSSSSLGGLITDREANGYYNRVVGGDGLFRWGDEAVRIEFLGSSTKYPDAIQSDFDQPSGNLMGTSMRAAYEHATRRWTGYLLYQGAGDDFRADLGFIPQVGYHKGYGFAEKYWYSDHNEHWWTKLTMGSETTWLYDRQGNPLQQQVAPYFLTNASHEFFNNTYAAIGPYWFKGVRFNRNYFDSYVEMRPTGTFYYSFEVRAGQEVDYDNVRQGNILRLI
ncbi:MAG TPA: DUF5916 domain-containing protein, partial [Acidobacteriota bacterium]|nr:DUF5916 domain-containing protein [Acidobacteriota bacterium]